MSRDSNYTYVHTHASHHADLFEEFCRPPVSTTTSQANNGANNGTGGTAQNAAGSDPDMIHVPGHFLPFEEIQLPPHLMPVNPEDEDDVVPDMHAAFGIQRALGQNGPAGAPGQSGEAGAWGANREPVWRDLGMERLLETGGAAAASTGPGFKSEGIKSTFGGRREGRRSGLLLMR